MRQSTPLSSLYLHVPFCSLKCSYCAFNTYANIEHLIPAFVDALIAELQMVSASRPGIVLHTVFFGGGTPTLLTPGQFERILNAVHDGFHVLPNAEITAEANPDDLTLGYTAALRQLGINRLSIGMQSSSAADLKLFARQHTYETVVKAVEFARAAGFDNLNLDLMYGIPQQTLSGWATTLRAMLTLAPAHVSLYALGLEEGTPLKNWVDTGHLPAPDDDLAADMYDLATTMLADAGFEQYEISNWSQPGRACLHNLQYWYNDDYIGVGPGAHGFAGGVRYATILKPLEYIRVLMNPPSQSYLFPRTPATEQAHEVTREDEIAETLMMTLRLTRDGVQRATFRRRFGIDLLDLHSHTINKYTQLGLLEVTGEWVRLTARGRLLSNAVFRDLI